MLNRKHYFLALGAVVLLTVVLLKLPERVTAQVKLAISGLFLPLFGLAGLVQDTARAASFNSLPRSELERQFQILQRENQQLKLRLMQLEELARENSRLRQHLGLAEHTPWKLKLARVIGRDPANWWHSIRIDVGLKDGVPPQAPVLTEEGLVGRVSDVGYAQSQVLLLGDPDCRVSVLVQETRDHGIIGPIASRSLDATLVDLSYLSRGSELKVGYTVVTSGLGGIFPKGILVGHIVDFEDVDFGLYTRARVKLAVNMSRLEEVWVKLP